MKKALTTLALVSVCILVGCKNEYQSVDRNITVEMVKGQKLVEFSWDRGTVWILSKPMTSNDVAETYRLDGYRYSSPTAYKMTEYRMVVNEKK
jgi:uncharacterized lipoprotein NlpE involved in copper resistance